MKLINHIYKTTNDLKEFISKNDLKNKENLFIQVFSAILEKKQLQELIRTLKKQLPNTKILGTTTFHEISNDGLHSKETIVSFSIFKKTKINTYLISDPINSFKVGQKFLGLLEKPNNKNIKVAICFANPHDGNGEDLLDGINSINQDLVIAGGIAGDFINQKYNYIFTEKEIIEKGAVFATFESPDLEVLTDYNFNWDAIGKKHKITKSVKNRVYTIDDIPTIDFYKHYLGDNIEDDLIEISLGIPLIIEDIEFRVGRNILKIHEDKSISYGGNLEVGSNVRLGYGNTHSMFKKTKHDLINLAKKNIEAIYIYSCVERKKAFLNDNLKIEIEQYAKLAPISGFLTYGEFYKGFDSKEKSKLLNQTMTILALSEDEVQTKKNINLKNIDSMLKSSYALNSLISKTSLELEDLTQNLENRVQKEILKNEQQEQLLTIATAQAEVGYMLEMIAHQWRQPLSAISSLAGVLQLKNTLGNLKSNEIKDLTDEILEQSKFASDTIEDFRELFKPQKVLKNIKIYDLMSKIENILKPVLNLNQIKVIINYKCDKEFTIKIPVGQLLQVAINIFKNSIDAIKENEIKDPIISIDIIQKNHKLIFKIEDNAGGIPEEILPKIFDKRFSTKWESHGTGLGLDICKSIIEKNLKGAIKASNGKNGAVFEVTIPIILD